MTFTCLRCKKKKRVQPLDIETITGWSAAKAVELSSSRTAKVRFMLSP